MGLEMKTRLATVEENIGGEEAKTVSLDNFFKEFCSTWVQRIRSMKSNEGVCFLRQEIGLCAVGNARIEKEDSEIGVVVFGSSVGQQQEQHSGEGEREWAPDPSGGRSLR